MDKLDLAKLTGSEKQVAWAKSILESAYRAVETEYQVIANRADLGPKFLIAAEKVANDIRAKMEENTNAGSVIDRRGAITYSVLESLFLKEIKKITD